MSDALGIVEAMRGDLDRFAGDLGARSYRLAVQHMAELRRELYRARLSEWGLASRVATLSMVGEAVQTLQLRQTRDLTRGLPAVVRASRDRQAEFLRVLDERYSGAVRPLRFDTLAWVETQTRTQIRLRQFPRSFARYGAAAVADVEDALARLTITGQPWDRARGQVWAATRSVVMGRQWMVDRILRTETAAIYNGTALAAMEAEDDPDDPMLKRLVATFDARTGADSVAVHGQIRALREPFQDPRGRLYQAPPNRPHDREVVVPHRAAWGERPVYLGGPKAPEALEETSTPEPLPPPPPSLVKAPIGGSRVPAAAAAVLLLSGQLAEARRARSAGDDSPAAASLEALLGIQLEEARVTLAAARLADQANRGEGLAAGSMRAGEVLSAAGLAVRVVRVEPTRAGVSIVFAIGDARVSGEFTRRFHLPFRRTEPTLTPSSRTVDYAAAAVAAAIRAAISKHGGSDIMLASR